MTSDRGVQLGMICLGDLMIVYLPMRGHPFRMESSETNRSLHIARAPMLLQTERLGNGAESQHSEAGTPLCILSVHSV